MGFSGNDIDIGVGVHANQDAAQVVDKLQQKFDALRQTLAGLTAEQAQFDESANRFRNAATGRFASLDAARESATAAASAVNTTIGAFQRLGEMVDVTDAKAVRAFRQEGDAVSGYLARLGATDVELNKIGTTIATMEQRAGRASVTLGETIPDQLPNRANASVFALRRGADAVTALSFAATSGKVNVQSFAIELGSVSTAAASLSGASLLAATGIGALVSIGLSLVGVLSDIRSKAKQAKTGLDDLSGLSASTLHQRALDADAFATSLANLRAELEHIQASIPARSPLTGLVPPDFEVKLVQARAAIARLAPALRAVGVDAKDIVDARSIGKAIDEIEKRLDEVRKRQFDENKAAADAERKSDADLANQRIKDDQAVVVARTAAAEGERAARFKERQFELENTIADIKASGARQGAQDEAIAAARRKSQADVAKDERDAIEAAAKAKLDADTKTSNAVEQHELAAAKATQDKADAAAQASRDLRRISEQQLIAERLRAEITEINAEERARLTSIGRQIVAQQALLDTTVDPEKRAKIVADLQALQDQLDKITLDANNKRVTASTTAAKDIAAVQRQLVRTVQEGNIQALQEQSRFVEAAQEQVQREFRDAISEALALAATGDTTGIVLLAQIGQRAGSVIAKAAVTQIEHDVSLVTTAGDALIQRTTLLLESHAITQSEARQRIVQALVQERDAVAASIPLLEEQAAKLPGDEAAQARLEQYRTKLLQLNITIRDTSDQFFNLKVASVGALQQSLTQLFDALPTIGTGGDSSKIGALRSEIQSANDELTALLKVPAAQRTGENDQRITQLRTQLAGLNSDLAESKKSVTTLGEVFARAALSMVQSIERVVSEMLAQLIVQRLLRSIPIFGSLGSSNATTLLAAGVGVFQGAGAPGHATGGLISGPGTPTSDSILARLSAGEFVLTAAAVRRYGVDLLESMNAGLASVRPHRLPGYAEGGMVSAVPVTSTWRGESVVRLEASRDVILEVLSSSDGQQVQLANLQRHGHTVRRLFGRG